MSDQHPSLIDNFTWRSLSCIIGKCFELSRIIMSKKIYYWKGCINETNFSAYETTIHKLLSGDYQSADLDLKVLKQHRVWTVRINNSDRLLFTTIKVQGDPQILILDVIENHDYQKSLYFRRKTSKQLFEAALRNATDVNPLTITQEAFVTPSELELPSSVTSTSSSPSPIEYSPVHNYDEQFISFNDEQLGTLHTTMPMVVTGPPGSGKSSIAVAMINQLINHMTASSKKILYVTESTTLTHRMAQIWQQMPESEGNRQRVCFLSYDALLKELCPDSRFVNTDDCLKWLEMRVKSRSKLSKELQPVWQELLLKESLDTMNQEFRIMSVYTEAQYTNVAVVGTRVSKFDVLSRKTLFAIYVEYTTKLASDNRINPAFYSMNASDVFEAVVVDEAQNLSTLQLDNLHRLTHQSNVCYLLDSNQAILDSKSKRPFLTQYFHGKTPALSSVELSGTYRSPNPIIHMANSVLDIRDHLIGGVLEKGRQSRIAESTDPGKTAGVIEWLDPKSADFEAFYQHVKLAPFDSIVITTADHRQEATELFSPVPVFTLDQIQGGESLNVVLYRFFDPFVVSVNQLLKDNPLITREGKSHLSKNRDIDDSFVTELNGLLVAITRSTQNLYIAQSASNKSILINLLRKLDAPRGASSAAAVLSTPVNQTDANTRIKQLLDAGNRPQAKHLFMNGMAGTDVANEAAFEDFIKRYDALTAASYQNPSVVPRPSPVVVITAPVTPVIRLDAFQRFSERTSFFPNVTKKNLDVLFDCFNSMDFLFRPAETLFPPPPGSTFAETPSVINTIFFVPQSASLFQDYIENRLKNDTDQRFNQLLCNYKDTNGISFLHYIVMFQCNKLCKLLLNSENINTPDNKGVTPLFAFIQGNARLKGTMQMISNMVATRIVDMNGSFVLNLIELGANVNISDSVGSLLYHAKKNKVSPEIIRALENKGAIDSHTHSNNYNPNLFKTGTEFARANGYSEEQGQMLEMMARARGYQ